MPEPFFSILLPTKNRSVIVGDAIQSILTQTFGDFELIISNNDDFGTATEELVAGFKDDRIRYFRTEGNLSMHENWESVSQKATGRHIFVLEDKTRLVANALEFLHQILVREPDAVVSFPFVVSDRDQLPPVPLDSVTRRFPAEEILARLADFDEDVFPLLPRGVNSTAPRSLLEALRRSSPTGRLYSYVAPDYSQCYQILSRVPEILTISGHLVYAPKSLSKKGSFSNGGAVMLKSDLARRWFKELPISEEVLLEDVPVKSVWLWINLLIYDYHVFVRRPGFKPHWNWVRYHSFCLYLIAVSMSMGGDMATERRLVWGALRRQGLIFTAKVAADFIRRSAVAVWRRSLGNREL